MNGMVIETDDRGDTGNRGVGERLWNEHGPNGEAGDRVAPQPPAVVRDERSEEPESHVSARRDATRSRRPRRRSSEGHATSQPFPAGSETRSPMRRARSRAATTTGSTG